MKRILVAWFLLVLVAMTWVTLRAAAVQGVFEGGAEVWAQPWGRATLFDAYFAFVAVWLWMAARERSIVARVGWLGAVLTLGNFAIAAYFLLALRALPAGAPWTAVFALRDREAS